MVSTKYKIEDKKVKPDTGPLPADSEKRKKEVSDDPTLRKSMDIRHTFRVETIRKLRIGGSGFLLSKEEIRFQKMLKEHRKAFAFSPTEIGQYG